MSLEGSYKTYVSQPVHNRLKRSRAGADIQSAGATTAGPKLTTDMTDGISIQRRRIMNTYTTGPVATRADLHKQARARARSSLLRCVGFCTVLSRSN